MAIKSGRRKRSLKETQKMSPDILTSSVLLVLNIIFICAGGYGMSYLESRAMEKEVVRLVELADTVKNASQVIGPDGAPTLNMDYFISNASAKCENVKVIPWTYGQSFNFALSILTTVGWGVMKPTSYMCKAVVCFYALFGCPLYGIFIALIKDRCGRAFRKTVRVSRTVSWYWLALSFVILITIFLNIFLNLLIEMAKEMLRKVFGLECNTITPYSHWQENSTLWDGIYFGFITVSTIGFGDTYLRLMECEKESMDSVMSAVAGFFLFSFLLGMMAHLFDILSEKSETGLSRLSMKLFSRRS